MGISNHTFVLVLVLILCYGSSPISSKNVYIWNDLMPNVSLTIHCKSKNDDLGQHIIHYKKNWNWNFQLNLWFTTLFWCNAEWVNPATKKVVSASFVAYEREHMLKDWTSQCFECIWSMRKDGLYHSLPWGEKKGFRFAYAWGSGIQKELVDRL
ncbi:hypothetical protein AQUCO_05700106v1 [Aquilegia coerulea]|uniref:S-protein homolog n=1 Tax=Aquilegia coerulea TaxID=218851 RepID=A0A2G5CFW7_AQUCA|nr:hypothetical protein AQUCO_05700106v1 [Aquilegia coerulea]